MKKMRFQTVRLQFEMHLILGGFLLYIAATVKGEGGCKVLEFLDCLKNKTLTGHVIKSFRVLAPGLEQCQHKCYLNDQCVSYNLGPVEGYIRTCELNDADNVTRPGHVVPKDGFEHCPIKNPCLSSPCPADRLCTPDFSLNNYSCDDGGWTSWGPWSNCSSSVCPHTRTRSCTNPTPQNNGLSCRGPGIETKECHVAVPAPEGCDVPLGMESGEILDSQITASSFYRSEFNNHHHPSEARLNKKFVSGITIGAWCAGSTSAEEYLQADLGSVKVITKIATQGRPSYSKWVSEYTVSYTNDTKTNWIKYEGDCVQRFAGNSDEETVVTNKLDIPIVARYIRIIVQKWFSHPCVRMELYGCNN